MFGAHAWIDVVMDDNGVLKKAFFHAVYRRILLKDTQAHWKKHFFKITSDFILRQFVLMLFLLPGSGAGGNESQPKGEKPNRPQKQPYKMQLSGEYCSTVIIRINEWHQALWFDN